MADFLPSVDIHSRSNSSAEFSSLLYEPIKKMETSNSGVRQRCDSGATAVRPRCNSGATAVRPRWAASFTETGGAGLLAQATRLSLPLSVPLKWASTFTYSPPQCCSASTPHALFFSSGMATNQSIDHIYLQKISASNSNLCYHDELSLTRRWRT